MKKRDLAVFLVLIISSMTSFGQQDAQYTQYMYNTISINPAYAGSRDAISIIGLYRNQWVGTNGAPTTQTFSVNSPIDKNNKVGLGLSVVNDEIGPTQETYIDIDFSYTINTSNEGQLAFGLKGGGHLLDVNFNELTRFVNSDRLLGTNINNKFSPNVGVGLYFHNEKLYFGLSAPNLLTTDHFNEDIDVNDNSGSSFIAKERINYYGIFGYVFDLSSETRFKPAALVKAVSGAPLQVDLSANFLMYDKLTLGLAYRWSAAFSGMVGFNITDAFMLGFAYDWETTELGNTQFNAGSFEFIGRYEIFRNRRIVHPRFF